ncbi:MAG: type III secretion system gatekeeper subunit SctW [Verrucomicrobia bacterium]|nr:type III secretion system gatekeeper subunit SctW [Verrucomicrobiota bacterium]
MARDEPIHRVDSAAAANARQSAHLVRMKALEKQQALEIKEIIQESITDSMAERGEDSLVNYRAFAQTAESIEKRQAKRTENRSASLPQEEEGEQNLTVIDAVGKTAEEFQDRNPEMEKRALLTLRETIHVNDSPEEILRKVLRSYPDHYLADEALDFLIGTTDSRSKMAANMQLARNLLNERFGREVRAGRNILTEAREFAKQGLGTPGDLRTLYRDVTGNPREAATLFEELTQTFNFDKMKIVLQFMLHSLGSDLKSKGPSIDPVELQRLVSETRTMQAILGVYRFFFERMRLIEGQFLREHIPLPNALTFELLAKQFVKILGERYPSPDKIMRLAAALGISEELLAQIIIFTQYRDALRGVSPRFFKSDRHRQDLLMALIETISELDDLLEEEAEKKEEDEENKEEEN